jgi:hypothetical protein
MKNLKTYNSSFTYQLKGLSNGATLSLITSGSTVHYKAKLIRMAIKIILNTFHYNSWICKYLFMLKCNNY